MDASLSAFPAASTAAFWPPFAPASCPPTPFSSISPRRSSARPSRLRLSDLLTDKPMRARILSFRCLIFRLTSSSFLRLLAMTPTAAITASAPASPPSSTTPSHWVSPPSSTAATRATAATTAPACVPPRSSACARPLWRSALPRTRSASCYVRGAIPSGICPPAPALPRASPRARSLHAKRST